MNINDFEYTDCLDIKKYKVIYKDKYYDFKEGLICYGCIDKMTNQKKNFKTKEDLIIIQNGCIIK